MWRETVNREALSKERVIGHGEGALDGEISSVVLSLIVRNTL